MRAPIAVLVSCLLALPGAASAQDWPRKGLTLVAPFTAGGITDLLTRIMADELGKSLGQPAVVENRGGAGGAVGLNYVLSQPADGYTLAMGGNGPSAIVPSLNPNVNYSPKNFEAIGFVAALPSMLVVHPSVPGIVIGSWNALYVKAGTPAPIVARLRAETEKILRRPDVMARIAATDAVTKAVTAERLGQMTAEEYEAYGRIAREGNIKLN